jgi:glycine reductase complex component B subunit alpha and beta
MNLDLESVDIKDVRFADKTTIDNGILFINKGELQELLKKDRRFSGVDIDLAHPGDSCRIISVFDVIEPRAKVAGTGQNFPGILGKMETAGNGRTRVLRGASVVLIDYTANQTERVPVYQSRIIDMVGPGVDLGLYGRLQNVVLLCTPAGDVARFDYWHALRLAGLKAAVYLAEAAQSKPADSVKAYHLESLAQNSEGLEKLPRIAYIYQLYGLQHSSGEKPLHEPIFYGDNVNKLLPTIVHPNEILDGGIVRGYAYGGFTETYDIQNHPIVLELYNRHGSDLCFAGVVLTVGQATEPERERTVAISAKLVKHVLAADGVIITRLGGGATNVDLAQTAELCEHLGVKTVICNSITGATSDESLVFSSPAVDAIVGIGSLSSSVKLAKVDKLIGKPLPFGDKQANDNITVSFNIVNGAMNAIGASKMRIREL